MHFQGIIEAEVFGKRVNIRSRTGNILHTEIDVADTGQALVGVVGFTILVHHENGPGEAVLVLHFADWALQASSCLSGVLPTQVWGDHPEALEAFWKAARPSPRFVEDSGHL